MAAAIACTGKAERRRRVRICTLARSEAKMYSRFSQQEKPTAAETMATVMPPPREGRVWSASPTRTPSSAAVSLPLRDSRSRSWRSSSKKSGWSTIQYPKYLQSSSVRAATTNPSRNIFRTDSETISGLSAAKSFSASASKSILKKNARIKPTTTSSAKQIYMTAEISTSTMSAEDVDRTNPDAKHFMTASSDTSKRFHLQCTRYRMKKDCASVASNIPTFVMEKLVKLTKANGTVQATANKL
mmetsp:Transcript_13282/g.29265  ORF Transcript_13282/g.29265 Transcript_13282/m.29265 type:complete len:243 (+) Transcript_13282:731-1459(+)